MYSEDIKKIFEKEEEIKVFTAHWTMSKLYANHRKLQLLWETWMPMKQLANSDKETLMNADKNSYNGV